MANEIILYNTDDGQTKVELHLLDGTVWLSELEIAELFQTTRQNINKHIVAILKDGELEKKMVSNYQLRTTQHGALEGKTQSREVAYYNLDMILAIGYRVRSARGAQFRGFASTILKGLGAVSRKSADNKVDREYKKYQAKYHEIAAVDKDYFRALTADIKRLEGGSNDKQRKE